MALLYDHVIATFDTEIQPTGKVDFKGFPPIPHPEFKKHHHEIHLKINGPDGGNVSTCINTAVTAPLIAALILAGQAGGGVGAAEQAIVAPLQACLGQGFVANLDDESSWITWEP